MRSLVVEAADEFVEPGLLLEEQGTLPMEKWLADLGRIEHTVAEINTPVGFASEAYTLREHIGLMRRAVMARTGMSPAPTSSN